MNISTVTLRFAALLLLVVSALPSLQAAQKVVPVFPGAQGFGTTTTAGRGGPVCIVSQLADSGAGTLRHCVEQEGPRNVVFAISGTIRLERTLRIFNPFISIYGQTAPADGIMVTISSNDTGPVLNVATHDVLIQHLRFRAGASKDPSCCRDAASISNPEPDSVYNVVIDHCSFSWGTDEVVDIWYDAHDITISRSIISEGLNISTNDEGKAGRGFIIGSAGSHSISVHHNLMAHNYQRNPLVKSPGVVDIVNNIVYHWVSRGAGVEGEHGVVKVNFVNNLFRNYKEKSIGEMIFSRKMERRQRTRHEWFDLSIDSFGEDLEIFLSGNIGNNVEHQWSPQSRLVGTGKNKPYKKKLGWLVSSPHPAPTITTFKASKLMKEVLPDVGATLPSRDSTDTRLIKEVETQTGFMPDCVGPDDPPSAKVCINNVGGWPVYSEKRGDLDSDSDGIPDKAELTLGFDPTDAGHIRTVRENGYTDLETWIHSQ